MEHYLTFKDVGTTLAAWSYLRKHGLDCSPNGKRIYFHDADERDLGLRICLGK